MLTEEGMFRLSSITLIALLFISISAIAGKAPQKKDADAKNIFAQMALVEEANSINDGQYNATSLTKIGATQEALKVANK